MASTASQNDERRRRGRAFGVATTFAAIALAMLPAPGWAADAELIGTGNEVVLLYTATAGERNVVTMTRSGGNYLIEDTDASITGFGGCTTPVDSHHAVCPAAGVFLITVDLGDGDDVARLDGLEYPTLPPPAGEETVLVTAGSGRDEVTTGSGTDNVNGGPGVDTISTGAGNDAASGGDDNDTIDAGPGDDQIHGLAGTDKLAGGEGRDTLNGGLGNDDDLDGGDGDDLVRGNQGNDIVRGGAGNDRLDVGDFAFPAGGPGFDDGRDTLEGGAGDDVLNGGAAPTVIELGEFVPAPAEPDVVLGGPGNDVVDYSDRRLPLTVSLNGAADDGESNESDNVHPDVERVIGGSESDSLTGSADANVLDGRAGDDTLTGGGGADTLLGGTSDPGSDTLLGGDARDTLRGGPGDDSLDGGADNDDIAGGGGTDSLDGAAGLDVLAGGPGIDALRGGDDADTLYGSDLVLVGADGADQLDGGDGDDTLLGGPGNDMLDGGLGADLIGGEDGRDTLSYETRSGPITVTFDGIANDGEANERDNVAGDVEIVLGGAVADTLTGDERVNNLEGAGGDDVVSGGAAADTLSGGSGSDVLMARDGTRDIVACGPNRDLAIIDRIDSPRDCELVDRGGRRRPELARVGVLRVVSGQVAIRLPEANRFVAVRGALKIPIDSTLDATRGSVALTTTFNRGSRVQTGTFTGGRFVVHQKRARRPVTKLVLRGGNFKSCTAARGGRSARVAAQRPIRRLWGRVKRGRGRYETHGYGAAGTVSGTVWLIEDRCDGTFIRVTSGAVRVRDFGLRRTVMVRAGESYLARIRTAG